MARSTSQRRLIVLGVVAIAATIVLAMPATSAALPIYTTQTGQACTVCHTGASGGPLTATGTAFAAIPTHTSDAAGAFARVSAPAAATTTAATTAAATTAAATTAAATTSAATSGATTAAATGAAPTVTAGVSATALPSAGGIPVPLVPVGVLSAVAIGIGLLISRRRV